MRELRNVETTGADVDLGHGIELMLARDPEGPNDWEVWGVRIDGVIYREPLDLVGERLHDGPMKNWVQAEIGSTASRAEEAYETNPARASQVPHRPWPIPQDAASRAEEAER